MSEGRDERPTADDAQWQGLQRLWAALGLQYMSMHNYVQAAERAEAMRAKIDTLTEQLAVAERNRRQQLADTARLRDDRDALTTETARLVAALAELLDALNTAQGGAAVQCWAAGSPYTDGERLTWPHEARAYDALVAARAALTGRADGEA